MRRKQDGLATLIAAANSAAVAKWRIIFVAEECLCWYGVKRWLNSSTGKAANLCLRAGGFALRPIAVNKSTQLPQQYFVTGAARPIPDAADHRNFGGRACDGFSGEREQAGRENSFTLLVNSEAGTPIFIVNYCFHLHVMFLLQIGRQN